MLFYGFSPFSLIMIFAFDQQVSDLLHLSQVTSASEIDPVRTPSEELESIQKPNQYAHSLHPMVHASHRWTEK